MFCSIDIVSQEVIRLMVSSVPDVIAIYHFGSSSSGQEHVQSDIDLAIHKYQKINRVIVENIIRNELQYVKQFAQLMMTSIFNR